MKHYWTRGKLVTVYVCVLMQWLITVSHLLLLLTDSLIAAFLWIFWFMNYNFSTNWFLVLFKYLEHPWLKEGGNASDKPIDSAVLSRMKQFRAMNKLKKLALKVSPATSCMKWSQCSFMLIVFDGIIKHWET